MAEDLGERTEEATPRRLSEARERGQVARSQDAASASLLAAVTVITWVACGPALLRLAEGTRQMLDGDTVGAMHDPRAVMSAVAYAGMMLLMAGLPMLLLLWICAYVSHFWQIGWLMSVDPLRPKLSKLNPISGFKRIFGISGLVKGGLDIVKLGLVILVTVITIMQYAAEIVSLPQLPAAAGWSRIGLLLVDLAIRVAVVLLMLGLIDFMYQRWKYRRDLRMTKQQVKDEMKHTEGDPEVKRRRLRMQQQIALQRISSAVPKADVIVTNPEHVSIAIKYEASRMNAPKVVAKGADYVAMRIRQIALQNEIPIVQRPPLARALYKQVKVGQEIPPDFYQAVAEILAHVYRLSGRMAG